MGKYLYCIGILISSFISFAQESNIATEKQNREIFKMYSVFPNGIGNNVIAKSHKPNVGIGLRFNVYQANDFFFGIGSDFLTYDVSNIAMVGNASRTNTGYFFLDTAYKIRLYDWLSVNPEFAFGYNYYILKSVNGKDGNMGKQDGPGLQLGSTVDFKIYKRLRLFTGVQYRYTFLSTITDPEFKSYYNNIQQLNIVLGIKI